MQCMFTNSLLRIPVIAILVSGSTMMASRAYAGSNGQQLSFCSENPAVSGKPGGYAIAHGFNQDGKRVVTHKISLRGHGNCENLPNWWYKGVVTIDWHDHTGKVRAATFCSVPTSRVSNYIDCDDVPIHDQLVNFTYDRIRASMKSQEFKEIYAEIHSDNPVSRLAGLNKFRKLVSDKGAWKLEDQIHDRFVGRAYEKGDRGAFWFQWDQPDHLLSYELWSNFFYGYMGRMLGISPSLLRAGDRYSEYAPGGGPSDPGDLAMDDLGIEFYKKYGAGATPARIAEFLRAHQDTLFKVHVAKSIQPFAPPDRHRAARNPIGRHR